jgi:hypothetical protein
MYVVLLYYYQVPITLSLSQINSVKSRAHFSSLWSFKAFVEV